jgi:hypothetical protein
MKFFIHKIEDRQMKNFMGVPLGQKNIKNHQEKSNEG